MSDILKQNFFDFGVSTAPKKRKAVHKDCEDCKLYEGCRNPKLGVRGEGKKGILIVGDQPTLQDDRRGKMFSGEDGEPLWKTAKALGIDLERDCYFIHSVQCHAYASSAKKSKKLTNKARDICRSKLHKVIEELQPKVIIPLGDNAIDGLIGDRIKGRMSGTKRSAFIGLTIPDQQFKAWVCPTYAPDFIAALRDPVDYLRMFKDHLRTAYQLIDKQITKPYTSIKTTIDEEEAITWLKAARASKGYVAFDYETTGISPYREGHRIVCASIAFDAVGYAFPFFTSAKWIRAWKGFLSDTKIKTIAHNLGFEMLWTKNRAGADTWPVNIAWDTCLGAHCLMNHEPTSLKFQTYSKLGVLGFDDAVDAFITKPAPGQDKKSTNSFNRIDECSLKVLLKYNAYDSLYTLQLQEIQEELMSAKQLEGFNLFVTGATTLAKVQHRGMNVNIEALLENERKLTTHIDSVVRLLRESDDLKSYPKKLDLNSSEQLVDFVFNHLGMEVPPDGKNVEEKTLSRYDNTAIKLLLKYRKATKVRDTFLSQFRREQVNGIIHPTFSLNKVKTFRSCIAKDTLILCNDSYDKFPNGKPIQLVSPGDYVYAFDDDLKLCLKKVLWAGKTGHREVIRVHFNRGKGNKGYLDLTPEHKVRAINGKWVEARNLLQDFRTTESKHCAKSRVLSCERTDQRLYATNNPVHFEHRFVYEQRTGEVLEKHNVIHHIDGNHYNNVIDNLQRLENNAEHAKLHVKDTLCSEKSRIKNIETVRRLHTEGYYTYKTGKDNARYINLSKEDCIRVLHDAKGALTEVPYDFNTFKGKCKEHGIDIKEIKYLYNKDGVYLSAEVILNSLNTIGHKHTLEALKIGYAKLDNLMEYWNITYERGYKNQNGHETQGKAYINNHVITDIEYINKYVDVYDLEVEDVHNFIANGICVHNSSQNPNFQNLPKHDKNANSMIRGIITPDPGCKICEYDYRSIEVAVGATYHKDPQMLKYLSDESANMHTDAAKDIYLRTDEDYTKIERQLAKGCLVFPMFYGSTAKPSYGQEVGVITRDLWEGAPPETIQHLFDSGIKNINDFQAHILDVEHKMWNDRFPVYNEWREKTWKRYKKKGYLDLYTGFRVYGPLSFTQVINIQTQGTASHVLLYLLTRTDSRIESISGRSYINGQIHDCVVANIHPEDEAEVDSILKYFGTERIIEMYPQLAEVPLIIEKDSSEIDGNWYTMTPIGAV